MAELEPKKDERMWGMLCHLTALVFLIGIPFGNILGPLVIWLLKRHDMPLVDEEGKEALNFQISMTIYFIVSALLCFVLIGFLFMVPLIIANLIFTIIAAVKTSDGGKYRYPLAIRFFK